MSLVSIPRQVSVDADGVPRVGAQWYFYESGTDNLIVLYTTDAYAVELANPVTSLEGGVFPAVHINPSTHPTHKQVMLDAAGLTVFTEDNVPTDNSDLRADLGDGVNGPGIELVAYPRTAAELASGVTPVTYWLEPGVIDRYQTNTLPNTTDMSVGLARATLVVSTQGGGRIRTLPGTTYRIVTPPIILEGCEIDLEGSIFNLDIPDGADVVGLDFRDNCSIHGGELHVVGTGGPTGVNFVHWCNVLIGAADGTMTGYGNCRVYDMKMSNSRSGDAVGGCLIGIVAGSYNTVVENIVIPDHTSLGAGIRVHWQSNGVSPEPTAAAYPVNFIIRNIHGGNFTKAATSDVALVDIVGGYNGLVENVKCARWDGDAVVQARPGAFGPILAPSDIIPLVNQGIEFRGISCSLAKNQLILVNGHAHGSGAIVAADYGIPVKISGLKSVGFASAAPSGTAGIRISHTWGVTIDGFEIEQHALGILVEETAHHITFSNGRVFDNEDHGIVVADSDSPYDITFKNVLSYSNNQANAGNSNFYVEDADRVCFEDCEAGISVGETAAYGFRIADASHSIWKGRNPVHGVAGGGTRYDINGPITGNVHFTGGSNGVASTGSTEYFPTNGTSAPVALEIDGSVLSGANCVLSTLRFKVTAAPVGATKTRTLTLMDDTAATALAATITDAQTTGIDYAAVEVAAGSEISIRSTVLNTPNAARLKWSIEGFLT